MIIEIVVFDRMGWFTLGFFGFVLLINSDKFHFIKLNLEDKIQLPLLFKTYQFDIYKRTGSSSRE